MILNSFFSEMQVTEHGRHRKQRHRTTPALPPAMTSMYKQLSVSWPRAQLGADVLCKNNTRLQEQALAGAVHALRVSAGEQAQQSKQGAEQADKHNKTTKQMLVLQHKHSHS